MNKHFLYLIVLLCFGINTFAQKGSTRFGIKGGLNLSTAFVDDATDLKIKEGYHVGATVDYSLTDRFLIQSGLFFSTKGAKINNLNSGDYVGGNPDFTHTFNQHYLEIPIHGAYKIKKSNSFTIILGGGPYFAYGIGGKAKQKLNNGIWSGGGTEVKWDTFGDGVFDEDRDWLHNETLKRFDFGWGVNADLEYQKMVLSFAYDCSIINIAKNGDFMDFKYRNSNVRISLGYKF